MRHYDGDWLLESRAVKSVVSFMYMGRVARNKFHTTNSGKNDNEKRKYCQKRQINENENTISLTKTIMKTKLESKTKLTLLFWQATYSCCFQEIKCMHTCTDLTICAL
jgi:hypothetical protein